MNRSTSRAQLLDLTPSHLAVFLLENKISSTVILNTIFILWMSFMIPPGSLGSFLNSISLNILDSTHFYFITFQILTWLIVGSLVRSIWNTGGGRVCCNTCSNCCGCPHTAIAFVRWSTPFSYSPWASNSSPSCISSRKNFWTASASLRSGNLESPALSLASFCFFLPARNEILSFNHY